MAALPDLEFSADFKQQQAVESARAVVHAVGAVRAHGRAESELTREERHAYVVALVLLTDQMKRSLMATADAESRSAVTGQVPLTKPPHSA